MSHDHIIEEGTPLHTRWHWVDDLGVTQTVEMTHVRSFPLELRAPQFHFWGEVDSVDQVRSQVRLWASRGSFTPEIRYPNGELAS